ncbi:MAG: phage protease, partial [Rhodoblastus sp.]
MQTASARPDIALLSTTAALASGVTLAALPAGAAPTWITIFPSLGDVACRDGRRFQVDGATLTAAFAADAIDLPIDISHATDVKAPQGERADAMGWVKELKVDGGALLGRVEWTPEGAQLVAEKKYRYTSPSFWHDASNRATGLRAVSLVNSPALGNQPALAAADVSRGGKDAHPDQENPMKTIATALGLREDANETACLAALNEKLQGAIPKGVHDKAVADLAAANAQLAAVAKTARDAKVETLIDGALKAKKLLPAEKEHFVALCATDEGLAAVEKLIAARGVALPASGLDDR